MVATFVKTPSVVEQVIEQQAQQQAQAKRTGIVRVPQNADEEMFTKRFHVTIRSMQATQGKLDQCGRMIIFLALKKADGVIYTSKHVALAEMLAAYHGWPRHLCAIQPSSGVYSYNQGRKTDRAYCAIETEMVAWLHK